jgi:arylsulfatase A-like enzyme
MKMKRLIGLMLLGALSSFGAESSLPNVVVIYADDLGYGDLGCYGADTNMVRTPNIDSLAAHGRRFTDAHSASAVCTPSRYALLTGEYPFRENLYAPIFLTANLIIPEDTTTVADVMKNAGYATGMIGKWHMGFQDTYPVDWNAELKPGPLELGFDYYYGVPTVNSHPPFVYVENHRVVGHVYDTNSPDYEPFDYNLGAGDQGYTAEVFEKMKINDIGGSQAAHALYNDYEVGLHLAGKAVDWIDANKDDPFLLILTATQVHHPFTPAPQFQGTSGCGLYGDFIHELDYIVGLLLQKLEDEGLTENTLVIFTSDNGAMANVTGQEAWHAGHHMNGSLLGFKSDGWEGGHRIPFIAKWPGHIPTNTVSDQLIGQVDFLATMAALTETEISEEVSPDGINILPALVGETDNQIRDYLICAPYKSTFLVLRQGDWAYLGGQGSAGWNNYEGNHTCSGPKSLPMTGYTNDNYLVTGSTVALVDDAPDTQLYNLANDLSQSTNVVENETVIAEEMASLLATLKVAPISTSSVVVVTGAVNVAEAYIDENTVPDGWQYLYSSEAIGGMEAAMPSNVTFETGRTGFGFSDFPKLLGHVTGGVSFTINPANTANAAVEGTDLLISMGNTADNDHVIIQYTIQAEDVAAGTNAWITGSFRDLSGKATGGAANSIVGSVYHNSTLLFSATGANGILSQANGTFELSGISIEAGDTIRFVIGNNGSYEGDESALEANIGFDEEIASVSSYPASFSSGLEFEDGIASVCFTGTLGQDYRVEYSENLSDTNGWQQVEEHLSLPMSPRRLWLSATNTAAFYRVVQVD